MKDCTSALMSWVVQQYENREESDTHNMLARTPELSTLISTVDSQELWAALPLCTARCNRRFVQRNLRPVRIGYDVSFYPGE